MSLGMGQYSREVAQDPRRYFLNLQREMRLLNEEQRQAEEKRLNSMDYKLQKLAEKFSK